MNNNNPIDIMNINWGGNGFPSYQGLMSAAAPAVPNEGSPPPAEGSGAQPAPPAGGQAPGGTPTPNPANDPNIRQLREGYERWNKLGKFEEVQAAHTTFTALQTEASSLAKKSGYTDEDFKAAFAKDPVKTLQILRSEAARTNAQPRQPGQPDIEKILEDKLKPITEEMNLRKVQEANMKFDSTVEELVKNDPNFGADAPEEVRNLVYDAASMLFQVDEDAVKALKFEGKTVGVQKAVKEATDILNRAFTSWQKWQSNKTAGPGRPAAAGAPTTPGKKLTLDDIINGEDSSGSIKSFGR